MFMCAESSTATSCRYLIISRAGVCLPHDSAERLWRHPS